MSVDSRKLDRPGAGITYDIRPAATADAAGRPGALPLLLIGSPMDAGGFALLADHFTDRTVITYDPRGVGRSQLRAPVEQLTPDDHAADVAAVLDAAGVERADLFATSGGAVNALALVAGHPGRVHTLVAHEPPLAAYLQPDGSELLATAAQLGELYQVRGMGPAMAKFITLVGHDGPLPAGFADQPAPDPAMFGLPAEDDGGRQDPLLGLNIRTCIQYRPHLDAVRAGADRVIVGVGEESANQVTGRAASGLAAALGDEPVRFPSHHSGFTVGPFGPPGQPDAFAAVLRSVLNDTRPAS